MKSSGGVGWLLKLDFVHCIYWKTGTEELILYFWVEKKFLRLRIREK
jgi:hypothetical protein